MMRRTFLTTAAAGSAMRVLGSNDRIGIGLIGCGAEGTQVAELAAKAAGSTVLAVCDVYETPLLKAKARLEAERSYKDFRRLLEDKDIDVVVVATPDHWHAAPSVLACEAGKDVYVEKPLAHDVREGRKIVDAAGRYSRIVQLGAQQRTSPELAEAERIVRSGELGRIHYVRVWDSGNAYPGGRPVPDTPVPSGLDWDFFLGPAPLVPYNAARHHNWRGFHDYGGGDITDLGTHWIDTVHQIMGRDVPLSVTAHAARYCDLPNGDMPDILQITYEYPGFLLNYENCRLNTFGFGAHTPGLKMFYPYGKYDRPHGIAFYGTNGTMVADRYGFEIFPEPEGSDSYRMERKQRIGEEPKRIHVLNFIDCVRSRKRPNADVEIGHRSSIPPHIGNIAARVKRTLFWDGQKEEFRNDPEATRLLGRTPRQNWTLI